MSIYSITIAVVLIGVTIGLFYAPESVISKFNLSQKWAHVGAYIMLFVCAWFIMKEILYKPTDDKQVIDIETPEPTKTD